MKKERERIQGHSLLSLLLGVLLALKASAAVTNYDENIAYNAVMYSAATYCKIDDVVSWYCGRPCDIMPNVTKRIISQNKEHDLFGFIAYNNKHQEIIVAFRGTNGLDVKNWYLNMKGDRVPFREVDGALIHVGWYSAWE